LLAEAGIAYRAYDPIAQVPADVRASSRAELVRDADVIVVGVPVPRMRAFA
jgi:hypothetical protein